MRNDLRILALFIVIAIVPTALAQTEPTSRPADRPRQGFRTGTLAADHNPALPTIFLIGDSTVKNSWDKGDGGLWGWGRPFSGYFDQSKINVENQALGGTSSRSYITGGNWERVLALVKPGDFLIMQFGTNDGGAQIGSIKGNGEETRSAINRNGETEVVHSYGWYIRKYITDTKAKGANAIVCSLIPRNDWKDGKVARATETYSAWCKDAAKQGGALFIDLNGIIADHYDKMGADAVKPLYPHEHVHTSWDGAVLNASCVVEGIRALPDSPLVPYLLNTPIVKKPTTVP